MTDKSHNRKPEAKPLSLYGMKPEDALRKALSTPPPKPPKTARKKSKRV